MTSIKIPNELSQQEQQAFCQQVEYLLDQKLMHPATLSDNHEIYSKYKKQIDQAVDEIYKDIESKVFDAYDNSIPPSTECNTSSTFKVEDLMKLANRVNTGYDTIACGGEFTNPLKKAGLYPTPSEALDNFIVMCNKDDYKTKPVVFRIEED